jgi:hypothetical protein
VKSGTVNGECKPIAGSRTVRANKKPLLGGSPAFVSHPALEWGPKLWGAAKKLLPKKMVGNLAQGVRKVRERVLAKLDGSLGGAGSRQAPEVAPPKGGASIPNPDAGGAEPSGLR